MCQIATESDSIFLTSSTQNEMSDKTDNNVPFKYVKSKRIFVKSYLLHSTNIYYVQVTEVLFEGCNCTMDNIY